MEKGADVAPFLPILKYQVLPEVNYSFDSVDDSFGTRTGQHATSLKVTSVIGKIPMMSKVQIPSSNATASVKRITCGYTAVMRASFRISKPD